MVSIKATVAKIDKLLDKYISRYNVPDKYRGVKARVVPVDNDGIAIWFEDGTWHVIGRGYIDDWHGRMLGKYNTYVTRFVGALRKLGKITREEQEVFEDWLRAQRKRELEQDQIKDLKELAKSLGYTVRKSKK